MNQESTMRMSIILMKIENLEKKIHDAYLEKQYEKIRQMADDLIVCALQIRQDIKGKKSPQAGA